MTEPQKREDAVKVFLSYSSKDLAFVEQLYKHLTNDGMQCFFDRESIAWGSNWVVELDRAVADCDIMVIILSPDYCKSEWGLIENTSARVDDPAGLRRKIRPLLLEPCREVLPAFLKPIQHIDVSSSEKFAIEYPKIRRELRQLPDALDQTNRPDLAEDLRQNPN